MVVRRKMNQTEQSGTRIPAEVRVAKPIPIDQVAGGVDAVRERIQAGRAYLKVVEYPWGVEFDVCDAEEEP